MAGEVRTAKMYLCAATDWGRRVTRCQSRWSVCAPWYTLATKGVSMGYPQSAEVYTWSLAAVGARLGVR